MCRNGNLKNQHFGATLATHFQRQHTQAQTQHIYMPHMRALLQMSNIRRFHSSICSLITYLFDILVDEIETMRRDNGVWKPAF